MKNKIIQLLQSTAGMLIFALLSGCAYYIVVIIKYEVLHAKHTVTHICRRRIIRIFLFAGNHIRCGACAYKNNKAMYGKR